MEEYNEECYVIHKINAGFTYTIKRQEYQGFTFYKAYVKYKNFDGTEGITEYPISFRKGVEVADGTKIKINKAVENVRFGKNDVAKKIPIFFITILDFDVVSEVMQEFAESTVNVTESYDDLPF